MIIYNYIYIMMVIDAYCILYDGYIWNMYIYIYIVI